MSCGAEIGAAFVGVVVGDVVGVVFGVVVGVNGVDGGWTVLATVSIGVSVVAALAVADATAIWNCRFDVSSDIARDLPLCFGFVGLHSISLCRISAASKDRKLYWSTIDLSNESPSKSGTTRRHIECQNQTIRKLEKNLTINLRVSCIPSVNNFS